MTRKTRTPEYRAKLKRMTPEQAKIVIKFRKDLYYEAVRRAESVLKQKGRRKKQKKPGYTLDARWQGYIPPKKKKKKSDFEKGLEESGLKVR